MMKETENIVYTNLDFLPLKTNANIVEGNALRIDWNDVVPKERLSYIMGNPPFLGARNMSTSQKEDVFSIFHGVKDAGNLDYVTCWYKKASDYIEEFPIVVAFVSTNTIVQGEQPAIFWKVLFESNIKIGFAYRTFIWDSEASVKAHVHCVIIGFGRNCNFPERVIFDNGKRIKAKKRVHPI
jgi:methylase of polypeptide subunit release factors